MKKILFVCCFLFIGFYLVAGSNSNKPQAKMTVEASTVRLNTNKEETRIIETGIGRIKLTVNNQEIIINLYNYPTNKDLLSMLPLTMNFRDYAATEKIAYLPRKLTTQSTDPRINRTDDFAYFAPWGNLAIFYKDKASEGSGLIVLGTIESGKSVLANLNADFTATIERID